MHNSTVDNIQSIIVCMHRRRAASCANKSFAKNAIATFSNTYTHTHYTYSHTYPRTHHISIYYRHTHTHRRSLWARRQCVPQVNVMEEVMTHKQSAILHSFERRSRYMGSTATRSCTICPRFVVHIQQHRHTNAQHNAQHEQKRYVHYDSEPRHIFKRAKLN